jgi:hypothetical protein
MNSLVLYKEHPTRVETDGGVSDLPVRVKRLLTCLVHAPGQYCSYARVASLMGWGSHARVNQRAWELKVECNRSVGRTVVETIRGQGLGLTSDHGVAESSWRDRHFGRGNVGHPVASPSVAGG